MKKIFKENDSNNLQSIGSNSMEDSIFSAVFNNNQAVMLLVDSSNHRIIDANGAAEHFYGYTRDKLLSMDMRQINILTSEERPRRMEEAIHKSQGPSRFVHKTCSGMLKNVEVYTSQIVINKKNIMFLIVHDITEQKTVESKLAESELRFRRFFENSPFPLWEEDFTDVMSYLDQLPVSGGEDIRNYLDAHPKEVEKCVKMVKILDVNPVTLILYDAQSKEDLFWNLGNVFTPDTYEAFKDELISLYNKKSVFSAEIVNKTLSGRIIYIKLEMAVLFDYRVLVTIADISELKNKELELKEFLEQTRADSETKEILLREINHRVKNNLSSFIGMLYAEKKQSGHELKGARMEHVDSLINRVKGISIAHDLLSRSQWAPISLFTLSEKIVHSLNHLIPADKSIKTEITPSSVFLDADQSHSMAVVINELFTNCIEHASLEGEAIKVKIEIKERKGKITYIYNDTGPGFPEKVLNAESYNVGLYLIKNIVEQSLRGTVDIENKGGARVILQFPGGTEFEEL